MIIKVIQVAILSYLPIKNWFKGMCSTLVPQTTQRKEAQHNPLQKPQQLLKPNYTLYLVIP